VLNYLDSSILYGTVGIATNANNKAYFKDIQIEPIKNFDKVYELLVS